VVVVVVVFTVALLLLAALVITMTIIILIIGLCILLHVYQSIKYIETSVRNKCRCSFYCALFTLHVSAPIGGRHQVICNKKFEGSYCICQLIHCVSMVSFNNLHAIKYKNVTYVS
jgi:hypothetical protein